MKQGVQLLLERVRRHRAFPRMAASNGQNLQTTLSPANIPAPLGSRLESVRFVPVLAEALTPNVSRVQNTVSELEPGNEMNAVAEETSLEVEAAFSDQTWVNDSSQVNPQIAEQIFETLQGFESTEIAEPKTSSENLVSEMPGERVLAGITNPSRVAQASEIPNGSPINQTKNLQDAGTQTRAPQNNLPANQQSTVTPQPRATLRSIARPEQENSSVESLQLELATPVLSPNLEQGISFSDSNQNENTKSSAEENPVSVVNTFLETQNSTPTQINRTVNASDESQLEPAAQIEAAAQPVRSPSRLESTLEALRQFDPKIQNDETIMDSQPRQPNPRATKTSNVSPSKTSSIAPLEAASKIQASAQKPLEPNLAKSQVQAENQNSSEPIIVTATKPQPLNNQNPSAIQDTLEPQAITRANPVVSTESASARDGTEVVQAENIKTLNASLEAAQTDLRPSASEQFGFENQINPSDPSQNEIAALQTNSLETSQAQTKETQTKLPQTNSTKPEPKRELSSLEKPDNQRPSEDTRENAQSSSVAVNPTVQAPLSEEAREREAYQRAVTMRAERTKRALAAKEELERDPTLELETKQTLATSLGEPQQTAAPDKTPSLESQTEAKIVPSIEAGLENLKTQTPEVGASSQGPTPDLKVVFETTVTEQFTNNLEALRATSSSNSIESLSEILGLNSGDIQIPYLDETQNSNLNQLLSEFQPANSSEFQPANSSEFQPANSSEFQLLNSDQASTESSELQTFHSSETQTLDLNQSLTETEIQPSQSVNQTQTPNLAQTQSQDQPLSDTPNPNQALKTPNQDVPASFLSNTQGVSVYNPQRRIQRAAPTPAPKPKPEPTEAQKLFADAPGMSEQEILEIIRKASGRSPTPASQNPIVQSENTLLPNISNPNAGITSKSNESRLIAEVGAALSKTAASAQTQNAQAQAMPKDQNQNLQPVHQEPNASDSSLDFQSDAMLPNAESQTSDALAAASNALDAQGNKIHVFNPPNRRVAVPKPKVEAPKTEAQKLFDAIETTETADELFQRVVKNRLKPNTNLEPQEQNQTPNPDTATSSVQASTPSANQALLPNLPNLTNSKPSTSSVQAADTSFTGSERVQLSQNATRFLKPIVGIDPNDVNIYRDPQSERLTKAARADALTVGDTVLLSSEQALESPETLGLIAHELTHVARNRQARFVPPVARGNNNLAASAQADNEEGLALGVEAFVRQGWNNFNQNSRSQTTSSGTTAERSSAGSLPAPADLPQWFIEDRMPPQASPRTAPRANNARSAPGESPFVPQAPTNPVAASMGAQAASQGRDLPTPPPAAGPLPASTTPKPEPIPNRAAPDLDAMARQVYTILKRRLANERHRM